MSKLYDATLKAMLEASPLDWPRLLQGVTGMKESVTYQAIVEEGVQKAVLAFHEAIFELGEKRFGSPAPEDVRQKINGIEDLAELRRLIVNLLDVDSWAGLVAGSRPTSRTRRRKS
jgi:hypothetical protein